MKTAEIAPWFRQSEPKPAPVPEEPEFTEADELRSRLVMWQITAGICLFFAAGVLTVWVNA